jgi:glutathione S-transferase
MRVCLGFILLTSFLARTSLGFSPFTKQHAISMSPNRVIQNSKRNIIDRFRRSMTTKNSSSEISSTNHTPGHWRLLYFDAPTRGEQIRLLFKVANIPFDDVRLEFPKGLIPYKTATMGDQSPLLGTDKCPAVTSPEGEHCVETADIMRFVGKRLGLAPESEEEGARAVELTLVAQKVLDEVFYPLLLPMVYQNILDNELWRTLRWVGPFVTGGAAAIKKRKAKLQEFLTQLEYELEIKPASGDYFFGERLTYADVAVYSALAQCFGYQCFDQTELIQNRPKLSAFMDELSSKTSDWFDERTREHQGGHSEFIDYIATVKSPFAWTRRKVPATAVGNKN